MQSGTTSIYSIRIYNLIKQGIDHDPRGTFIRYWIQELSKIKQQFIHTTWQAHMGSYPMPIWMKK